MAKSNQFEVEWHDVIKKRRSIERIVEELRSNWISENGVITNKGLIWIKIAYL